LKFCIEKKCFQLVEILVAGFLKESLSRVIDVIKNLELSQDRLEKVENIWCPQNLIAEQTFYFQR
jgi:hypothetical protein